MKYTNIYSLQSLVFRIYVHIVIVLILDKKIKKDKNY